MAELARDSATSMLRGDRQIRCVGFRRFADFVGEWRGESGARDLNDVPVGELPVSGAVAELAGAEKIEMDVSRTAVLRVLEMMVFQIGERMAHMLLARPQCPAVIEDPAAARDRRGAV